MRHYQLQQALKALRDQGYDVRPKLNSKTFILQAEYDRLQKQISEAVAVPEVVEAVEVVEVIAIPEVSEVVEAVGVSAVTEGIEGLDSSDEIDANLIAYYSSPTYLEEKAFLTQMTPEQRYEYRIGTLACDIDQPELYKTELTDNARYLYGQACELPQTFNNHQVATLPIPAPVPINHAEFGVVICLMVIECWRVVASLLVPLIIQTFIVVCKAVIASTLVIKGFKQAASLAKKSLQIA